MFLYLLRILQFLDQFHLQQLHLHHFPLKIFTSLSLILHAPVIVALCFLLLLLTEILNSALRSSFLPPCRLGLKRAFVVHLLHLNPPTLHILTLGDFLIVDLFSILLC